MQATRRRILSSPTRKSASWPTTRSAMHWWRPSNPTLPRAEDHHYPPHLWRTGLHHAGGRGQPLPDEQGRAGKQDRHPYRRTRRRGSGVPSITTGASNDIEQATKLARAMLTRYGMSKDFDMVALETVNNQYLGGDTSPRPRARGPRSGRGGGGGGAERRGGSQF